MIQETSSKQSKVESAQPVTPVAPEPQADSAESVDGEFASMLKGLLRPDAANQVNEEEFFAALIQQRIQAAKGDEAAAKYGENLQKYLTELRRADGYVSFEDSARAALRDMAANGDLSTEEAEKIHAESFKGAQLDDNLDMLYDGRGGEGDPTIAVADMTQALLLAEAKIAKFAAGEEDAGLLSLDMASNTAPSGHAVSNISPGGTPSEVTGDADLAGFLFKPESEKDGTLVILAPAAITGLVESVLLKDESGQTIEEGTFSSVANGDREHFRFSKPGGEYPANLIVEILKKDGSKEIVTIADPSQRVEQ